MPKGVYTRTKEHNLKISLIKKNNQNFLGRKHSEETKKRMSLAKVGKKHSKEAREKMSKSRIGKKGRPHTEETKRKLSIAHSGEKHRCWKGGITPINTQIRNSFEYRFFRKGVFLRDNFTCQKCKQSGGELNAHHINNFAEFPELRMITENAITLCKKCHKKFHRKFGSKNNTKEQLIEFLNN